MISKAIKCDRPNCGITDMLDPDQYQQFIDEGAARGWVRLFINKPRHYSFSYDDQRSSVQGWYDLCSIGCASSILMDARDPE